jgi:glucokinase
LETYAIGALDIGGTKVAATVANARGLLARVVQPTAKTGSSRALGEQAIALLEAACNQANIACAQLSTVGVSSCGPFVLIDNMIALAAPNICGGRAHSDDLPNDWQTIPLEQVLRERFAHVVIRNDCVTALVAERMFGAVQDEANCVYATWSTGIGFGLCVDGHILNGKNGNAGHAGHMLLNEQSDMLCGCGNRGDVEAMVSGRNLGKHVGRSTSEVFSAAHAGEPAALETTFQAARSFGRALYNIAVTLDTRVFIIGGSIWTHHGQWLAPIVEQEIAARLPALTQGVSIVPADLGELVTDIGALAMVMPTDWIPGWRGERPWRGLTGTIRQAI